MPEPPKSIILLASRPETVEIAVQRLAPAMSGVIFSQDVLLAIAEKCKELEDRNVVFRFKMVDDPMEISDTFSKFEPMLAELESAGLSSEEFPAGREECGDSGAALAAMTCSVGRTHA
jgi:hypothetical protein